MLKTIFPQKIATPAGLPARRAKVGDYVIEFRRGVEALAIVFAAEPSAGEDDNAREQRLTYLAGLGYAVMQITPRRADWYQSKALQVWLLSEPVQRLLKSFKTHAFIGASMGGFAAITFSRLVPGAVVLAHSPQSTLSPALVPWEQRFPRGRQQAWQGEFADAATAMPAARLVYVTYDPFHRNDARHVARLACETLIQLKMPFLGHETYPLLAQLKILEITTADALSGVLTAASFAKLTRNRRMLPLYYENASRLVRKRKYLDALLFDAAKRHDTDAEIYRDAVQRLLELRLDRRAIELYYGRQSISRKLPAREQGILRAEVGLAELRNDPGQFEVKLRRERAERIAKLVASVDLASVDVKELTLSARFMKGARQWPKAVQLAQAVLNIEPGHAVARRVLKEAQAKLDSAEDEPTPVEKVKRMIAGLW